MATIAKRETKSGDTRCQVKVRIHGRPPATATFPNLEEAREWAAQTEDRVIEVPS